MNKSKISLLAAFVIILFLTLVNISVSQVTDKDGNVYKTITIGKQVWTAENLNVEHYRNGDIIPQVQDAGKWANLKTGAWCYYKNDPENGKVYGKLYNWYAVNDPRGLAPKGWHVLSDKDWNKLVKYLGGEELSGGKMKSTTLWKSPNVGATNEIGFSAIPGGLCTFDGEFLSLGAYSCFWTSTEDENTVAWFRVLGYDTSDDGRGFYNKEFGLSVRCVKD